MNKYLKKQTIQKNSLIKNQTKKKKKKISKI